MNVFVTGANRGLGAGFVQHYLHQGCEVWASYRQDKGELGVLATPSLHPVCWDVSEPLSVAAAEKIPDSLDLVINNAGIYGENQSLAEINEAEMLRVFRANAVAPVRVVQTLLPALQAAGAKGGATIANLSSKMGSVDDNTSGGVYAYRASKSALCNISRSMAHDLADDGIRVVSLHPGWVRTDMTNHSGLIDIATSVAGMADVIANTAHGAYPPGAFVAYDGQIVPY